MNKADKILIVCLLLIATMDIGYSLFSSRDDVKMVAIECADTPTKYYKIPDHDTKYIIGYVGELRLQIDGRRVRITHADCPDKVCANYGWLTSPAGKIVCLPNKIVIKLVGDSKLDAIVQ